MRTLYLVPGQVSSLGTSCRVLSVSPLLRELLLHAVERRWLRKRDRSDRRLAELIIEQLRSVDDVPLRLSMPRDDRARQAASLMLAQPAHDVPLARIAARVHTSSRTLERLFVRDTGMSFREWRQQAFVLRALTLLGEGLPVTTIAIRLGYDSPSAFIYMFRRVLGTTPGRYFSAPGRDRSVPSRA